MGYGLCFHALPIASINQRTNYHAVREASGGIKPALPFSQGENDLQSRAGDS